MPLTIQQRAALLAGIGCPKVNSSPDIYKIDESLVDPANPYFLTVTRATAGLTGCDGPFASEEAALAYLKKQHPNWTFASMCPLDGLAPYPWYFFKGA